MKQDDGGVSPLLRIPVRGEINLHLLRDACSFFVDVNFSALRLGGGVYRCADRNRCSHE